MRRAVATALLVAGALLAPAGAGAQEHGAGHGSAGGQDMPASILFSAFGPAFADVLAGDTITWTNNSVRRHDVTADDGTWSSGSMIGGATFARRFDAPGVVAYHCSLHPFMRGQVGVHDLLLGRPEAPGVPGRPFTLRGRAALPAGSPITIEADAGAGFVPVARTAAGSDGTFAASFRPSAGAQLRAVAGASPSPPVQLLVLDRRVAATAHTSHGRTLVRTSVLPASPGATVVLQLRLPERFGWWPVRHATLDGASRALFRLRMRRSVSARVVLTLADRATPLALSPTLRVGPPRARRERGKHHHH